MDISYKAIEERALGILAAARVDQLPIELDSVADYLNVDVAYEDLDDNVSGFLKASSDRVVAVINSKHHRNRKRFTLAHELGHYVLHAENAVSDVLHINQPQVYHRDTHSSEGIIRQEIEANRFASALLMPKHLLDDLLETHTDLLGDSNIDSLAKDIGVSVQALSFRLSNLGYEII